MKQTIILTILDGWGIGSKNDSNPIHTADLQTIKYIEDHFAVGALSSSGISVGLPWGEEGNSEVGHLTLGAGRVLYQHFLRISKAIENGSFFKNKALLKALNHVQKNNSALHLIGLITKGSVHASLNHIKALVEMAKKEKITNVFLHLFTDGRDSPPYSALELIGELEMEMKKIEIGIITTISGRYYALDRDNNWDLTEKSYKALIGEAKQKSKEEAVQEAYDKDLNDEYVEPVIVSEEPHPIRDNDAIIFFDFREDRMKQISESFLNPNFSKFAVRKLQNVLIATMTQYHDEFPAEIAFQSEQIVNTLGQILAKNGRTQLRLAETTKWAHVTFFFNGLEKEPLSNEFRVLIPSAKLARPAENPSMMAEAITNRALVALRDGSFDFILINYANPDFIAHTGNYHATIKAVKIIDIEMNKLLRATLDGDHILMITSDHGNAEAMMNLETGEPETQHNSNPVPFYLIGNKFKRQNTSEISRLPVIGILADVAPTILEIMGILQPPEMTGSSLLKII